MDKNGWKNVKGFQIVRAGRFPEDCSTAAMINVPPYFYQIRWKHLESYEPEANKWYPYPGAAILPGIIGPGADIVSDGKEFLYITRGGRTYDFWQYEIKTKKIVSLAPAPEPIGTGSRMAYVERENAIYVLRGDETYVFWRYKINKNKWEILEPLPLTAIAPIGRLCTGLVYTEKYLLCWADHHVRNYNLTKQTWDKACVAVTFRPSINGCMFTYDKLKNGIYLVQGGLSMTIGYLSCHDMKFSYLQPRLPDVVSVEGNRLVIAKVKDTRYLYLYRGHGTSEFWRIKLNNLIRIST